MGLFPLLHPSLLLSLAMAMVAMVVMDMEAMASVRLSQAMVVLLFIPMVAAALSTEPLKVLLDMVVTTARGVLMLDTMVVLALMSTRPVLTPMDLTDMVLTTTARGQLMLDILVMDMA